MPSAAVREVRPKRLQASILAPGRQSTTTNLLPGIGRGTSDIYRPGGSPQVLTGICRELSTPQPVRATDARRKSSSFRLPAGQRLRRQAAHELTGPGGYVGLRPGPSVPTIRTIHAECAESVCRNPSGVRLAEHMPLLEQPLPCRVRCGSRHVFASSLQSVEPSARRQYRNSCRKPPASLFMLSFGPVPRSVP